MRCRRDFRRRLGRGIWISSSGVRANRRRAGILESGDQTGPAVCVWPPSGRNLLFGLPGNPVSALVTFLLLVRPALLRWQGAKDVSLPAHPGVLAEPLANPGERRHFMRVKVDPAGKVQSAGLQASHVLSSLAAANGLVDVPANTTLAAGSAVTVLRWDC